MRLGVLSCLILALLPGGVWAATSYQVNNASNTNITEFSTCKKVTNNHASGQAIFVPTATSTEWSTFYSNPPAGVTIGTCSVTTVIFLTTGTSWTVPSDWNSSNNKIEVIGGGGGGGTGNSNGGGGGGGGAYSRITNLTLTPGASVSYVIGTAGTAGSGSGGAGGDTYFNGASLGAASVGAKGGTGGGGGAVVTAGAGGAASSGVGTLKKNGGAGAAGTTGMTGKGAGGGGAGGPNGDGNAGSPPTTYTGGSGDAGVGGAGGANHVAGGAGTEFDATHGSGGGGGGTNTTTAGGTGGLYGGGGGGANQINATGGPGAQGIIVITYTP